MNDDKLMNEALKEHARNEGGIDQSFLNDLEARIEEDAMTKLEKKTHPSRYRYWCAAAAVAVVGLGVWALNHSIPGKKIPIVAFSAQEPESDGTEVSRNHHLTGKGERKGAAPIEEREKMSDPEIAIAMIGENPIRPVQVPVPESFGDELAILDIDEIVIGGGFGSGDGDGRAGGIRGVSRGRFGRVAESDASPRPGKPMWGETMSGNRYGQLIERGFQSPLKAPLSTFSIDVDTASYTNIRKQAETGRMIDPNAVRIEEMVNYFSYDYEQPAGEHPFSVRTEVAGCPWNSKNRLVKIGLQGKEIEGDRKSANLAFLIDVSGSMSSPDKLPLLVQSFEVLLKGLNESDRVSLVVYAGRQAVLLRPTSINGNGRQRVKKALRSLAAGGSTNGAAGISTAYDLVRKGFIEGGVNRVILATDGDFNVGTTNNDTLLKLVKNQAEGQISLTILGFGQGNLNDDLMEQLTNNGDGNYFYIDSLREGQKVFQHNLSGTLETIAKDVKIQVEFNPGQVAQYRLVGYANRMLRDRDFADDKIDSGDIGAGHRVTALYEIVPAGAKAKILPADLKYQKVKPEEVKREVVDSPEMLTVKLRYKQPDGETSTELSEVLIDEGQAWERAGFMDLLRTWQSRR